MLGRDRPGVEPCHTVRGPLPEGVHVTEGCWLLKHSHTSSWYHFHSLCRASPCHVKFCCVSFPAPSPVQVGTVIALAVRQDPGAHWEPAGIPGAALAHSPGRVPGVHQQRPRGGPPYLHCLLHATHSAPLARLCLPGLQVPAVSLTAGAQLGQPPSTSAATQRWCALHAPRCPCHSQHLGPRRCLGGCRGCSFCSTPFLVVAAERYLPQLRSVLSV